MVQQTVVALVDDLDGSHADETVEFALDGVAYHIDLSNENADELRDALAQFVEHARRVGGRKRRAGTIAPEKTSTATRAAVRAESQKIRAWARDNGYPIADKGRIPDGVVAAYRKRSRSHR